MTSDPGGLSHSAAQIMLTSLPVLILVGVNVIVGMSRPWKKGKGGKTELIVRHGSV